MPSLVERAEAIATAAHDAQFRRDGVTPYIRHPEAVARRVAGDVDAEVVAWLHDVIEDTDETAESLAAAGIPDALIASVSLLTKSDSRSYEVYLRAIQADPVATKVKIADMLTNLSDNPTRKQIRKYAKGLLVLVPPS